MTITDTQPKALASAPSPKAPAPSADDTTVSKARFAALLGILGLVTTVFPDFL